MSEFDDALKSPEFAKLPLGEQLEISRRLDPEFAKQNPKDQGAILHSNKLKVLNIKQEETPIEDKGFLSTLGEMGKSAIGKALLYSHPYLRPREFYQDIKDTAKGAASEFNRQIGEVYKLGKTGDIRTFPEALARSAAAILPGSQLMEKSAESYAGGRPREATAYGLGAIAPFIPGKNPLIRATTENAGIVPAAIKGGYERAVATPITRATGGGALGAIAAHYLKPEGMNSYVSSLIGAGIGSKVGPFIRGMYEGGKEYLNPPKKYYPPIRNPKTGRFTSGNPNP